MRRTRSEPRLAWSRHGTGPTLVLVNTIGGSQAAWLTCLRELVPYFSVVTYDYRGTGASDPGEAQDSVGHLVADLQRLLDELSVPRAAFVGLGLGAAVVLELGVRAPERVERLVLVAASFGPGVPAAGDAETYALFREGSADPDAWLVKLAPLFFGQRWLLTQADRAGNLGRVWARRGVHPEVRRALWGAHDEFRPDERLQGLAAPTLLLHGLEDSASPIEHMERINRWIPGSRLMGLGGVGHRPEIEAPTIVATLVRDFLRQRGRFLPPPMDEPDDSDASEAHSDDGGGLGQGRRPADRGGEPEE